MNILIAIKAYRICPGFSRYQRKARKATRLYLECIALHKKYDTPETLALVERAQGMFVTSSNSW